MLCLFFSYLRRFTEAVLSLEPLQNLMVNRDYLSDFKNFYIFPEV